jgi:exodeoxyribonuclease-3
MRAVPAKSAFRVITINLNGIRAAARRGGLDWLHTAKPQVICMQEVRATDAQVAETLAGTPFEKWHVAHTEAPQLGRAGVAVVSAQPFEAVRDHVRIDDVDGLGRWIEVDVTSPLGPLTVVSVYIHTGEADTPKQAEKYAFLRGMDARLKTLASRASRTGREVLICGDFNVAHHEVDIKNWKGNLASAGFLPEERAYLDRWFAKSWVDLGRTLGGPGAGPYTWWSWRGRGFDTDGGWRIDYQVATPRLAGRAVSATVGKAPTYAERWSDHAPLVVDFA